MRWALSIAFCAVLALGCSEIEGGSPAPVLRWTAIPDANAEELRSKYTPISEYLSATLGVVVRYEPVADYKASVEAFKSGDVTLAWFGGLTGVQARSAVPGARAIAQGAEDPHYKSYFIAHVDSGLEPSDTFPEEISALGFTFGSPSSTSGRLMPEYLIRDETGMGPSEFFTKGFGFSGAHDKTALLVQEGGRVEAGVLGYIAYESLVAEGRIDPKVCRVIWVTPPYPDYSFTANPQLERDFGPGFTDRLQAALIGMREPRLLAALARSSLIAASNEDYAQIEQTALDLGLLR